MNKDRAFENPDAKWGTYSFTQNGKNISFPFQYTAKVANGRIVGDAIYYDNKYILETLGYKITPPENGVGGYKTNFVT